jgi:glycosyltransferase involved in cell wall biosynthesis
MLAKRGETVCGDVYKGSCGVRILICNNRYFHSSGPERYLFAITDLLERHGHHVVPLAADYAQTLDTPYRRYFVSPPVDPTAVFFSQYKDKLTVRERVGLATRAAYFRAAREAAARAIREQGIDLVYLLNIVNVLSPSIIDAARAQRIPVVMRLSDFNLLCPAYAFLRNGQVCQECLGGYHHALQHRCLQGSVAVTAARVLAMSAHNALGLYDHVSAFIAPSRYMADQMMNFTPARGKIRYLPSFVDQSLLDVIARTARAAESEAPAAHVGARPYLLYFGRIAPDKGVDVAIQAFACLERDVDLVIAGKDSGDGYLGRLQDLVASLGVANVRFVGFAQGEALSTLINGAICVLAPSICHDNAPMTVYEALAHGKVVIGSDLGGIRDQLEGDCGLLVPAGNVEALRTTMRRALDAPLLRRRLETAARHRAFTDYTPERHYEGLLTIFESALATSPGMRGKPKE